MTIDFSNFNSPRPDARSQNLRSEGSAKQAPVADISGQAAQQAKSGADSVSLSSTAKAISQLEGSLKNAPDVDLEKVEAIRARIASGDYQVNSENLAQKVLDIEV